MTGKHSKEGLEIKRLQELVELRDREIKNIKIECADQFKKIKDLCFINDYNDRSLKLRKIHEIASDNFSTLVKDIVISETEGKIIELPYTDQSNK